MPRKKTYVMAWWWSSAAEPSLYLGKTAMTEAEADLTRKLLEAAVDAGEIEDVRFLPDEEFEPESFERFEGNILEYYFDRFYEKLKKRWRPK